MIYFKNRQGVDHEKAFEYQKNNGCYYRNIIINCIDKKRWIL